MCVSGFEIQKICRWKRVSCGPLLTVVETSSLAETARRLNITPSAVVQRIRALEDEIGQPLIHRSWHAMRPTPAGSAILTNIVLPGRIATPRITFLDEQNAKREGRTVADVTSENVASIPAGRYGRPEEYADVVTFLAGECAAYVTGSVIRVDGGLIASI